MRLRDGTLGVTYLEDAKGIRQHHDRQSKDGQYSLLRPLNEITLHDEPEAWIEVMQAAQSLRVRVAQRTIVEDGLEQEVEAQQHEAEAEV